MVKRTVLNCSCVNGAYHEGICCETCYNHLKKEGERGDYREVHREEIIVARKTDYLKRARLAGFSKKQSLFLLGNT